MPAFCVAEAIARFRTLEKEARRTEQLLQRKRREAARIGLEAAQRLAAALEGAVQEQLLLIEMLPGELSSFMDRLFRSPIERLHETHEVVRRSSEYVERLQISRGDALVLAAIVEHSSTQDGEPPQQLGFLSGNTKDFGPARPAYAELREHGFDFFATSSSALGWLASKQPESSE
ncbi:MAG: hypothetical protein AB1Z98_39825 [Nannocystaceae bacterium]